MTHQVFRDALLVALFLVGLGAPAADHVLRSPEARSPAPENRDPYPVPGWAWSVPAIRAYPEALTQHFNDSLGWRDQLLHWNSLQQLELFGRFPSNALYTGRDGWWYWAENDGIAAWRGLRPFDERGLETWRLELERQRDWLRERGIEFLFVLAPNKETIYPEHLPQGYERLGPTRMEQFAEYMRTHSDAPFLDLRPVLLAEKQADRGDDLLYFPLGTHWTDRGSWIAYREIVLALRRQLPCLPEPALEEFVVLDRQAQGDSWAGRLYSPDSYRQACYEYEPREGLQAVTLDTDGRDGVIRRERAGAVCARSLVLHDSFGYKVDCYLAELFGRQLQAAQMTLDERLVDEAQPEVVIEIFAESKLLFGPPRLARRQDPVANRRRFDGSSEPLYAWDRRGGSAEFEGTGGAVVLNEPDFPGVSIATDGGAQTLLTPVLPFPRSGEAVLKLVLDSQVPQSLDVFYLREGDSGYSRARSFQLELAAGTNELFESLEAHDLVGRLSLRPRAPGRLVLRALELRAVR